MRKAEKEQMIAELQQALEECQHLLVCSYRGLNVKGMTQLRRLIRQAGGRLRVVKKTLFRRALGEGERAGVSEYLEGPVAVAFISGDALRVVKEITAFARAHEQVEFKGGWVEERLLDGGQLAELATLPPRTELLSKLLGCLSAPLANLVAMLQAVPRDLVLTLQAVAKKREGEAEA